MRTIYLNRPRVALGAPAKFMHANVNLFLDISRILCVVVGSLFRRTHFSNGKLGPVVPGPVCGRRRRAGHGRLWSNALLPILALLLSSMRGLAAEARPNILFILTEDTGDLGLLGTPELATPHMDALARSGVCFKNFFVAYPVCSPSKAAIYTGLASHENGIMNNTENFFEPAGQLTDVQRRNPVYVKNRIHANIPTLIERLHEAGYYQGIAGKLHVAPNEKFPFDEFLPIKAGEATRKDVAALIARAQSQGRPWHFFDNIENSHRPFTDSDRQKINVDPAGVKLPACLADTPKIRMQSRRRTVMLARPWRGCGHPGRNPTRLSSACRGIMGRHFHMAK